MNLYLIGYRCSGKTTIGRALAIKKGYLFFDTDEQISVRYNITIDRMIKKYGWQYFRIKEKKILSELVFRNQCVVATGGGIVLDYDNVYMMKKSGILIWLKAKIENIKKYILADNKTITNRPSLTGKKILDDIDETFYFRSNIYDLVTDLTILTDDFDVNDICNYILSSISKINKI